MRDEDGDQVVRRDGDPGGELAVLAGVGRDQRVAAGRQGEAGDAEQEAAARDGAGTDEGAPCPRVHDAAPSVRDAAAWWMALRTLAKVPQRQMFVSDASISSSVGFGVWARSPATAMMMPD